MDVAQAQHAPKLSFLSRRELSNAPWRSLDLVAAALTLSFLRASLRRNDLVSPLSRGSRGETLGPPDAVAGGGMAARRARDLGTAPSLSPMDASGRRKLHGDPRAPHAAPPEPGVGESRAVIPSGHLQTFMGIPCAPMFYRAGRGGMKVLPSSSPGSTRTAMPRAC